MRGAMMPLGNLLSVLGMAIGHFDLPGAPPSGGPFLVSCFNLFFFEHELC